MPSGGRAASGRQRADQSKLLLPVCVASETSAAQRSPPRASVCICRDRCGRAQ